MVLTPGKKVNGPRRWAEFVTPPRHRAAMHVGSYLLTVLAASLVYLLFAFFDWVPDVGPGEFGGWFWLKLGVTSAGIPLAVFLYTFSIRLRAPSA